MKGVFLLSIGYKEAQGSQLISVREIRRDESHSLLKLALHIHPTQTTLKELFSRGDGSEYLLRHSCFPTCLLECQFGMVSSDSAASSLLILADCYCRESVKIVKNS